MSSRLRTTWLAGSGALILVVALTGAALGATVLTTVAGPTPEAETDPLVVDTLVTFEDVDGDDIDDDCDTEVVADPVAQAAAQAAVDADGDGTISVVEAAHSDRIGGKHCNHGGYVSQVAKAQGEAEDADETAEEPEDADTEPTAAEPCVATVVPTFDPTTAAEPGAFGRYVSSIAGSDAVGGKHCNHGGAVSEAVKAAKEAAREARDAAKAERRAERDAAKAERRAAREAAKAARAAEKAEKTKSKAQGDRP